MEFSPLNGAFNSRLGEKFIRNRIQDEGRMYQINKQNDM